jgi:drug/metabolite transporter (DMT)-like permease
MMFEAQMLEMTPVTLSLVVVAAFIHATWNILFKRARGGLSFVWFVDVLQVFVFGPWIAWLIWSERPRLELAEWTCIAGSAIIHIGYCFFLQRGYRLGDISLVYPIARGSGPMLSSIVAILIFGERPAVLGILGITAIGGGIFLLTGGLQPNAHPKSKAAIFAGLLTGVSIAAYTVWDKYAVSVIHVSPVLLDLLANPVQALLLTPVVWNRRTEISRHWTQNKRELFGVTILNPISYILILMAMTVAPVSQIAPVREVSTLIGAAAGGRLFGEQHLGSRLAAASIIVLGVIAVAHG